MYVEAGFMKFVEHNDYNAQVNITFRDVASGRKGFRWMPTSFSKRNGYQGYIAPWVEEHWVPFCVGNNHEPNPPTTQGASYLMDFGVLPNWLTDNRANPDFAGTVDVYYVSNQSLTFGNETYYFGKYWSERQQKWIGLGTIRFTNDSGKDDQNRVIVDCTAALQCATCPDP
jgi:hypothetical protein